MPDRATGGTPCEHYWILRQVRSVDLDISVGDVVPNEAKPIDAYCGHCGADYQEFYRHA